MASTPNCGVCTPFLKVCHVSFFPKGSIMKFSPTISSTCNNFFKGEANMLKFIACAVYLGADTFKRRKLKIIICGSLAILDRRYSIVTRSVKTVLRHDRWHFEKNPLQKSPLWLLTFSGRYPTNGRKILKNCNRYYFTHHRPENTELHEWKVFLSINLLIILFVIAFDYIIPLLLQSWRSSTALLP